MKKSVTLYVKFLYAETGLCYTVYQGIRFVDKQSKIEEPRTLSQYCLMDNELGVPTWYTFNEEPEYPLREDMEVIIME